MLEIAFKAPPAKSECNSQSTNNYNHLCLCFTRHAHYIRQTRAAIKIQSTYRMYKQRRNYMTTCNAILYILTCYRRWKGMYMYIIILIVLFNYLYCLLVVKYT